MNKHAKFKTFIFFFISSVALSGCESILNQAFVKEDNQHIDQDAQVIKPALLSELARESGLTFTDADEAKAQTALENNFTHQQATWLDEINKAKLTILPTKTYQNANKTHCREYKASVVQTTREVSVNGVACRNESGTWQPN
jgi:surface antigen